MEIDCLLRIMVQLDLPFDESRKDLWFLQDTGSVHSLPVSITSGRLEDRTLLTICNAMKSDVGGQALSIGSIKILGFSGFGPMY
jgi:hypothetical protein